MTIKFLLHTTGEALACLCAAGLTAVYFRWRNALRKDFMAAFALVMLGIILREYAVWRYDTVAWAEDSEPLYFVTISRLFLIGGAAVYIRGAVKDRWGEWLTPGLIAVAFLIALVVL